MRPVFSIFLTAACVFATGCQSSGIGDDDSSLADDDDTIGGDDDTAIDPCDQGHTIHDLQQGHVPEQTEVHLNCVVVTSPIAEEGPGFFVQEPDSDLGPEYSGIFAYMVDSGLVQALSQTVQVGNLVNVVAMYQEYYGLSEVAFSDAVDVEPLGTTGTASPAVIADPCEVTTGGALMEAYEGVLVQIQDVTVTSENPDDPEDYGEFEVGGCLRIDDLFMAEDPAMSPLEGDTFSSITGLLHYSWGGSRLCPRTATDLVP